MTIECRRCDRCDLLHNETWRLAQRLADLERRLAAIEDATCATGWRTQWALRRLAERLGERDLARLLAGDGDDDTGDGEKEKEEE